VRVGVRVLVRAIQVPIQIWILCLALAGCASAPIPVQVVTPTPVDISLIRATALTATPLNVSIALFDGESPNRIYEPIREAESAYLPVQLRDTLIESGYWGAVNVVASEDVATELIVTGKIIESDAVVLALEIQVKDSRGRVWISKTYRDYAIDYPYEEILNTAADPFQDLYNQISNDMTKVLGELGDADYSGILDTALLRYAILLSPEAFSEYLQTNEAGEVSMQGLPARNDPLYGRVRDLREREFAMQDVVDEHFENFYEDMQTIYPYWRQSSYELLVYNDQLVGRDRRGLRSGSWASVERVYRTYKELKLNEDELRELASSFEREIAPTVTELEGRVIELQGSLTTQYKTWRRILRQIYSETRGL
jgi:hypothetical protein